MLLLCTQTEYASLSLCLLFCLCLCYIYNVCSLKMQMIPRAAATTVHTNPGECIFLIIPMYLLLRAEIQNVSEIYQR